MPSKYLINIAVLVLCVVPWSVCAASAAERRVGEEQEGHQTPCVGFTAPHALTLEHLCIVSFDAPTEAPVYRAAVEGRPYRFLFDASGMALIVDTALWSGLAGGSTPQRDRVLSDVTPERLVLWHQDALYWARWLEMADEQWGGGGL